MRLRHLEAFRPVCPACRSVEQAAPLSLVAVYREEGDHIVEGMLHCSNSACQREYPILDGIPLLVTEIRRVIQEQQAPLLLRSDLSPEIESLVGDALGPGSSLDTVRQHQSAYASGHWSDLDPDDGAPSAVLPLVQAALELCGGVGGGAVEGPVVELGCAVGRASFALAEATDGLVLGLDLHLGLLRVASQALRRGRVVYPRRRVGLVYDRRDFAVSLPGAERVDFWLADALALPLPAASASFLLALNLLDCVSAPWMLLSSMAQVLRSGGRAALCTPYDWAPSATPLEGWLGGHSQRGPERGDAEPALRALLDPASPRYAGGGLRLLGEREADWRVRLHARSEMRYRVDMLALGR